VSTVTAEAQAGPVPPTAISSSPGIGALLYSKVSLSSRNPYTNYQAAPGLAASVHLHFTFNKDLLAGETVSIELVGFRTEVPENTLLPTGNAQFKAARWVGASEQIVLTADYIVLGSMRVELTLDEDMFGLRMPQGGVIKDSPIFRLSTDAREGPIHRSALKHDLSLGSFLYSSLEFSLPMAGHVSDIIVRFTATAPLLPGDQVEISLPGFSSLEGYPGGDLPLYCTVPDACILCKSICDRQNRAAGIDFLIIPNEQLGGRWAGPKQPFQAAWSQTYPDQRLVLAVTCGMHIDALEPVHVIVPSTVGITLPRTAIVQNDPSFVILSTARSGAVPAMNFQSVPPMGALLDNAIPPTSVVLKYYDVDGNPKVTPGQVVELEITFPIGMNVMQGEIFDVELPGFAGADTETCSERRSLVVSLWFERASWNTSSSSLALTASTDISKGTLVFVNVPASFALTIPLNGLEENHPALRLGGQFKTGPVMPTAISKSPAVSVLTDRSLIVSPPLVGTDTLLVISFRHTAHLRPLRVGEIVTFFIPGMLSSKAQDELVQMNGNNNPFESARWNKAHGKLHLRVGRTVNGTAVHVSIPASQGLRLPNSGMQADGAFLLLDEDVGSVLPTALRALPVGFLGYDARISFTGAQTISTILYAGGSIAALIRFTPSVQIRARERIQVSMAGFTAPGGLVPSMEVSGSEAFEISWTAGLTLEVRPGIIVPAWKTVSVQISLGAGIRLPVKGLRLNDESLTISTDAQLGPVIPTHLPCSQSVGSFFDTPSLSYPAEATPGKASRFTIAFQAQMQLVPGDSIKVKLRSHVGAPRSSVPILGPFADSFEASYSDETLTLKVEKEIPANTAIEITVSHIAGIAPPLLGLRRTDSIEISALAIAGSVEPTPFSSVHEVGYFFSFEVKLSHLTPGYSSLVTLSSQYALQYFQGDEIFIKLTNFTEDSPGSAQAATGLETGFLAHWHAFDNLVIATCTLPTCFSAVNIDIVGLKLPKNGLLSNDIRLTIHAADVTGHVIVAPTSPSYSPAAGLDHSSLTFLTGVAGALANVKLNFRVTFDVQQGSTLTVTLPGFDFTQQIQLTGESASLFSSDMGWSDSTLNLRLVETVSKFVDIELEVAAILPKEGIAASTDFFEISIQIGSGKFVQSIRSVQAVPGFQEAELSFDSGFPDLLLIFTHTTEIQSGTKIELYLPGLSSGTTFDPVGDLLIASDMLYAQASWHAAGVQKLFITISKNVKGMAKVRARISKLSIDDVSLFTTSNQTIQVVGSAGSPRALKKSGLSFNRLRHLLSPEWEHQLSRQKKSRDRFGASSETKLEKESLDSALHVDNEQSERTPSNMREDDLHEHFLSSATTGAAIGRSSLSHSSAMIRAHYNELELQAHEDHWLLIRQQIGESECKVMTNSSIRYAPSDVSQPVEVTISFKFSKPQFQSMSYLRIRLPQLTRPSSSVGCQRENSIDCRDTLLLSETGYWSVGRWDQASKILEAFTIANTPFDGQSIVIPSKSGFQIVKEGVLSGRKDMAFLFSLNVRDPDCEQPIHDSPAVGSLLETAVEFVPGLPGETNNMLLRWTTSMQVLHPGESIILFVPPQMSLRDQSDSSIPNIEMLEPLEFACYPWNPMAMAVNTSRTEVTASDVKVSWQDESKQLTLTFSKIIFAKSACRFLFGAAAGKPGVQLFVPVAGFQSGVVSGFLIASNAHEGPVGKTAFAGLVGIGAIYATFLTYSSSEGAETNAQVGFTTTMSLMSGDIVTLHLPKFGGKSSQCVHILPGKSIPRSSVVNVGWSPEYEELTLTIARFLPKHTAIKVNVPRAAGLMLPGTGLALNQQDLTIRVDAASATASAIPITLSDPIGSFLKSPKLIYDPPEAGRLSSLTISFTPQMNLLEGEIVSVLLPEFTSLERRMRAQSNPFGLIRFAEWDFQSSKITMSMAGNLYKGQQLTITLPGDVILLPSKGLQANQLALKLMTDAVAGPNPGVSIQTSMPVGSFYSDEALPNLSFEYANLAGPAKISLSFSTTMPLSTGEQLNISLPKFSALSRSDIENVKLDAQSASRLSAKWVNAHQYFQITWKVAVAKNFRYDLTILADNGIRLPEHGVRLNDPDLGLSCNARAGPITLIPIRYTQAVGVFMIQNVSFSPALAGMPADVVVTFQLNREIEEGEEMALVFTSRLGDACTPFQFPGPAYNTTSAYFPTVQFLDFGKLPPWSKSLPPGTVAQESLYMLLKARQHNAANKITTITIRSRSDNGREGIRLPSCGLSNTAQIMSISTNAAAGPSQGSTFVVASIGSFRDTSIVYKTPRAGSESEFTIHFRMTMQLAARSVVAITMPGFRRALGSGVFNVLSTSKCCSTGSCIVSGEWLDTDTGSLKLLVQNSVGYDQGVHCDVDVIVPYSAGIALPALGIAENSAEIKISTDSTNGIVSPISVALSTGVYLKGNILHSRVQFLSSDGNDPGAGEKTAIRVCVEANMVFIPGDEIEIRLPGFGGPGTITGANRECGTQSAVKCYISGASWRSSTLALVMTVGMRVPARTRIFFHTEQSDFLVSSDGVQTDDVQVVISSNAAAGPVNATVVQITQGIGSFGNTTALHVSPAQAAPVPWHTSSQCCSTKQSEPACCIDRQLGQELWRGSNITMSFVPSMPLRTGDIVMFRLCGFRQVQEQSGPLRVPLLPGSRFNGSWDQGKQQLDIRATVDIEQGTFVMLTILAGSGLLPPPAGIWEKNGSLNENRECLQVGSNAVRGPVPFRRVHTLLQPFGAFWNTSLEFGNPVPGMTSSVMLRMTVMMPLSPGDELFVHMPGFSGATISCEATMATPDDDAFSNARWSGTKNRISIIILKEMPVGTRASVFIPSTSSITLPPAGIDSQTPVYISADSASGPVQLTKIVTMPGIGYSGFCLTSELSYGFDPRVKIDVPIRFKFSYNASLYSGDTIQLHLPDFEAASASFFVSSSIIQLDIYCQTDLFSRGDCELKEYFYPVISEASWNVSTSLLILSVRSDIRYGTIVLVEVGKSQGFKVPQTGSAPNSKILRVKVDASAGSQAWIPIMMSAGVGAFADVELSFHPPKADTITDIVLHVTNMMQMLPNAGNVALPADTITLSLPEFQGMSTCISSNPTRDFPFEKVCWSFEDKTFVMHVGRMIPRMSFLEIRLSTDFGVRLPREGLLKNEMALMISARAWFGNVADTSIRNSPAIGFVTDSRLTFDPLFAGMETFLGVRFTLGMDVDEGETFTLHLPGFFSSSTTRLKTSLTVYSRVDQATWYPESETLVMSPFLSLSKGDEVYEIFRTPINLPHDGIRWYSTELKLSSSAQAGLIPPTTIPTFPPVGSIRYAELRVMPPHLGENVAITLIFQPRQIIEKGTTVEITLGGFSGPSWAGPEYGGNGTFLRPFAGSHPAFTKVSWVEKININGVDEYQHLLTLFVNTTVNENEIVTVSLGEDANIKLPEQGILPNSDLLTIASAQQYGTVSATRLWRSPGIQHAGTITHSILTYQGDGGPHANADIDLELRFKATVTIFPGDLIFIALPKFTCSRTSATAQLSHPEPRSEGLAPTISKTQATWDPEDEVLVVAVNFELPGSLEATVFIPRSEGIRLPLDGVNQDQADLKMLVHADAGNVQPVSIVSSPAIGSVSTSSSLSFYPAQAGKPTNMTLAFATHMRLQRFEKVHLTLPFFTREKPGEIEFEVGDDTRSFLTATWDPLTSSVVLQCNKTLEENVPITILLSGFTVPVVGVRRNQPDITVSVDAIDGAMLPTTLIRTQGIGSMAASTALAFDPRVSNSDLDITFLFVPEMDLTPGDIIVLSLPEFYRSSILNRGLVYECSNFTTDMHGVAHCSGAYACISDLCEEPLQYTSSPTEALHAVRWREQLSVVRAVEVAFNDTVNDNVTDHRAGATYLTRYGKNGTRYELRNISFLDPLHELEILVVQPVPRGISTQISVLRESHLRAPTQGLKFNDPNVTVRAICREGDMPATNVVTTGEIGSFQVAALVFSFPQALRVTGIAFSFSTTIVMEINDTLALKLPRFTQDMSGPASFDVSVRVQLSEETEPIENADLLSTGRWIAEEETLKITIGGSISRETLCQFVITPAVELRLPNGVQKNSKDLKIMLDSVNGQILLTPIYSSSAVGAFQYSRLSFHPEAHAGEQSEVSIEFILFMQVEAGDFIHVHMPGFVVSNLTSPVFEIQVALSGMYTLPWTARWFQNNHTITCAVRVPVARNERIQIKVLQSVGFIIPAQGVPDKTQIPLHDPEGTFSAKADAKAGDILLYTPFQYIDPVGSFFPVNGGFFSLAPSNSLSGPSMSFSPPKAPTSRAPFPSQIDIAFYLQMPLRANEMVELTCLNFQGASKPEIMLLGNSNSFRSGSWQYLGYGQVVDEYLLMGHSAADRILLGTSTVGVLRLKASAYVPAGVHVAVTVPSSAGIMLPNAGIRRNRIWIQTRALAGPVSATPVMYVPVGSFMTTPRLDYLNKRAGEMTDIVFRFTASMIILKDEYIVITLPFWTAPGRDFEISSTPPSFFENHASWTSETYQLEFTASNTIPANLAVQLTVPQIESQLMLPLEGTKENDVAYTVSCSATEGIVANTPIWGSPAVGSFYGLTKLDLFPLRAGAIAALTFSFATKMTILPNEILKLRLPDFTMPNIPLINFLSSAPQYAISNASWDQQAEMLMFTTADQLAADVQVTIFLQSESGLRISSTGVRSNEHSRVLLGENFDVMSRCPDFSTFPYCRSCDRKDLSSLQLPEVSINSRWGPVLPTRVYRTPAIGAFVKDRIHLFPAKAGFAVTLEFSFIPTMTLSRNSTVILHLPKFRGAATQGTVNASIFDSFSWDQTTELLIFTVGSSCVQRGETAKAILPASIGIRIGVGGINEPPTFYANNQDGPIPLTIFSEFQKIGSFSHGNVRYEPPKVNSIVAIVAQFIPTMDLWLGDQISLTLTSVELADGQSCGIPVHVQGLGKSSSISFDSWSADWTGPFGSDCASRKRNSSTDLPKTLIVTINSTNISAGTHIEMTVSNSSLLQIRASGTTENDPGVSLSTKVPQGMVISEYPYIIPISEQIRQDANTRASSIAFGNPRWNSSSSVILSFRFDVVTSIGDRIFVYLPKFNGGPVPYQIQPNNSLSTCFLPDCSGMGCSLSGQAVAKGGSTNLSNISASALRDPCGCYCVADRDILLSNAISHSFEIAREGQNLWEISNLSTSFIDTFSVEWRHDGGLLMLTSKVYLPTNYTTVVNIPESFNFILPVEGVTAKSMIKIEAQLVAGLLDLRQLQTFQPVGRLSKTRLHFDNAAAPNSISFLPCKIVVSFELGFTMLPGDLLMINLPGFNGPSGSMDITSSPMGAYELGSWEVKQLSCLCWSRRDTVDGI
jgi:hypothetical protein